VRDIVELTITNELNPLVRKRLTEVVQILQVYARLVQLAIAVEEKPSAGDVALSEDMARKSKEWAEDEKAKVGHLKELISELGAAMRAHPCAPRTVETIGR
jgi:hypothetical protein